MPLSAQCLHFCYHHNKIFNMKNEIITEEHALGLGGVAIGTAFEKITDEQAQSVLEAAWNEGIRYYDTSPCVVRTYKK
ncbi:hypothetical protein [Chryseobacterium sp. GP-SGM7]|uniref:hypothetical protein n=1 Tax=Chryseobacterium sp. GP-SGM7 TaxID=3411323 RepID=UPI003B93D716